mgnify:CR=1 FL=1
MSITAETAKAHAKDPAVKRMEPRKLAFHSLSVTVYILAYKPEIRGS